MSVIGGICLFAKTSKSCGWTLMKFSGDTDHGISSW